MRRASIRTIANVSLWETIRRSLATTFITLLPVAALYFFGGETLKDFAFALIVGIGSGAYSSIFIAAPLVAWLKEREPSNGRGGRSREEAAGVDVTEVRAEDLIAAAAIAAEEPTRPRSRRQPAPVPERADGADGAKRERRRRDGARVRMAEPDSRRQVAGRAPRARRARRAPDVHEPGRAPRRCSATSRSRRSDAERWASVRATPSRICIASSVS